MSDRVGENSYISVQGGRGVIPSPASLTSGGRQTSLGDLRRGQPSIINSTKLLVHNLLAGRTFPPYFGLTSHNVGDVSLPACDILLFLTTPFGL